MRWFAALKNAARRFAGVIAAELDLGRPAGLPDCPFRKRYFAGGFAWPTSYSADAAEVLGLPRLMVALRPKGRRPHEPASRPRSSPRSWRASPPCPSVARTRR